MAKYSIELRFEVVIAIENGESINGAACKFSIPQTMVREWWRRYSKGGVEALVSTNQHYSGAFKQYAVEYRWLNDLSYSQAATDLGIPNQGTLYAWEKLYLEKGESALLDTAKGRPANMSKKQNSPKKKDEQLTREQELEAENARLRMENAYLKKLKALVAEREKSERKTK